MFFARKIRLSQSFCRRRSGTKETYLTFPELKNRSSEVARVRDTFEKLHLLLRAANSAFLMGNLGKASSTLHDAVELFRKLENSKAIGIANNNLGNVMLAMYRAMDKTSVPTMGGLSRKQVISKGCKYFKRAIDSGEEALERINTTEGWSENYLVFMQQLSNRYFNRAMFLLTVRKDHPNPDEAENQGLTDLSTCKDMDREVVDNGERVGFKGDEDVYFELLLGRIKGMLLLMKMDYDDVWGIDELFGDAQDALAAALRIPNHALFRSLDPSGQMQRLDGAVIEYYLLLVDKAGVDSVSGGRHENVMKAAMTGIRMLVEDDYVIGEAAMVALRALVEMTSWDCKAEDVGGSDPSDVRSTLLHYRHQINEVMALARSSRDLVSRECSAAAMVGGFSMEAF